MKALIHENEIANCWCEEIKQARHVTIASAMVTRDGLLVIESVLRRHLKRRRTCRFLVGVDMPTEPDALTDLLDWQKEDPSFLEVRCFRSGSGWIFHPKFGVFRRGGKPVLTIIGSSNLTGRGLNVNCEANVLIDDRATAEALDDYFEELWIGAYSTPLDKDWLAEYRPLWKERRELEKDAEEVRRRVAKIGKAGPASSQAPPRIQAYRFAFTGAIAEWPRDKRLYPEVRELDGTVVKDAKGIPSAHCLVHGNIWGESKTTQKLRAARDNDIPIITVDEFFEIRDKELAHRKRSRPGSDCDSASTSFNSLT